MTLAHLIPSCISDLPADAAGLARAAATYATRPSLRCKTEWTGTGLTRTLTVQVRNQKKQDCKGNYIVCVVLGTDGGSAVPTFTVSAGVQIEAFSEAQGGLFITDAAGTLTLSVTQTGAWTALVERAAAVAPFDGPTATAWAANAGAAAGASTHTGTETVDFGSGDYQASIVVTGETWVEAGSVILAQVAAVTTADHDPEDAALEGLTCYVGAIVAGTGFTIYVNAPAGTFGEFDINWLGV